MSQARIADVTRKDAADHPGRRKLIRALGVGGSGLLVARWSKPIVDSVVLPLHAQSTPLSVTINFNGLSPNRSPFTTYGQSGFTVVATSGNWLTITTFGDPAPFIQFERVSQQPTISARIQVTAGGLLFTFTSVRVYSSITTIPYVFTGLLDFNPVFTVSATQPNTLGTFATVLNPNSTDLIDTLLIRLSNPETPCCDNPVGLDNIVVSF